MLMAVVESCRIKCNLFMCRGVIMLTAVVESCGIKCNAYWPDVVGDSRKYNQITIQLFDIAEVSPVSIK